MKISSPCTGFCKFENDVCTVCWRTKEHLLNWPRYTEQERLQIMSDLQANKIEYFEEVLSFLDQYKNARRQLFEEMCDKLNVSYEHKYAFFNYCLNGHAIDEWPDILNKYLK